MAIVFGRVGLRKILLFLVLLGSFSELQAQKKSGSLRELNEIICHKLGGDFEKKYNFLLNGKGKVKIDCITGVYAIEMTREVGYANALYYALRGSYLTKKKAKIILYSKIGEKSNQFKRLREVIQFHKLTVDLEVIQTPLEFKKRKFKQEKQTLKNKQAVLKNLNETKKQQIKFTVKKLEACEK